MARLIRLLDQPHHKARALLSSGAPVYLPVNPVEFHGPHLSLHNDALLSMGLIRDLHAALSAEHDWPLLLSDALELGFEPVPGPGTRATPFGVLRGAVLRACDALADLGATKVVLVTFHGAPLHNLALHHGVERLRKRGVHAFAPMNIVLESALSIDAREYAPAAAHIRDDGARKAVMSELSRDFHAGFFETSLSMHWAPDSVSDSVRERLPPCPPVPPDPTVGRLSRAALRLGRERFSAELEYAAAGIGWYALRPFPGYTGRPGHASAEAGAFFVEQFMPRIVDAARSVFAGGAPPQPIMPWLGPLTLWGRVGGTPVPPPESVVADPPPEG